MIALALTLLCCLTAPAEVSIDKDSLVLGDLIEFPQGDLRATLRLGRAPNPGLARRLHDYEILGKLRTSGLRSDDLELPESVLIRRRSARLSSEEVWNEIYDLFGRTYPDGRIEILDLQVPAIDVATGRIDLAASLPSSFNPDGIISVRLDIRGESFARSAFIQTQVRIEIPQPVVTSAVRAHSQIAQSDVEWRLAPLGTIKDAVGSFEEIRGKLAKQDLEAGAILTSRQLYSPVLVRRGDAVTVLARVGGITVSAMMRARSAGKYGDTIIVEHLNGDGRATARITGQGTVEALVGGQR